MNIVKKFKKFMLNQKIKRCELTLIKLNVKTDKYHKNIMDEIINGEVNLKLNI